MLLVQSRSKSEATEEFASGAIEIGAPNLDKFFKQKLGLLTLFSDDT